MAKNSFPKYLASKLPFKAPDSKYKTGCQMVKYYPIKTLNTILKSTESQLFSGGLEICIAQFKRSENLAWKSRLWKDPALALALKCKNHSRLNCPDVPSSNLGDKPRRRPRLGLASQRSSTAADDIAKWALKWSKIVLFSKLIPFLESTDSQLFNGILNFFLSQF